MKQECKCQFSSSPSYEAAALSCVACIGHPGTHRAAEAKDLGLPIPCMLAPVSKGLESVSQNEASYNKDYSTVVSI